MMKQMSHEIAAILNFCPLQLQLRNTHHQRRKMTINFVLQMVIKYSKKHPTDTRQEAGDLQVVILIQTVKHELKNNDKYKTILRTIFSYFVNRKKNLKEGSDVVFMSSPTPPMCG